MPFIKGKYYMNPQYGHGLERSLERHRAELASSQQSESQNSGAHWVTIDGRHVLIQVAHGEQNGTPPSHGRRGPYIADLKSKEIAPLLDPNHKRSSADVVGPHGECVDLTKKFSGMLKDNISTDEWRAGPKVANNSDIKPGTAIATFDGKGLYPKDPDKNSGIYLDQGTNGSIWILDQWPAHPEINTPTHPPQPRELRFNDGRSLSNSAGAYHVILGAR